MTNASCETRIAAINVYPVKSCAGIALVRAEVAITGLRTADGRDREWMIVDAAGRFVTQRECPDLALLRAMPGPSHLALEAPGMHPFVVRHPTGDARDVVVWRDRVGGIDAGDLAARWLTSYLGRDVRLVRFDAASRRPCNSEYAGGSGAHTLFADGYPVLVIGTGSLAELNRRLAEQARGPLAMERFRPNVVLDGLAAHEEDHLSTIDGPGFTLRLVKPCTRCTITNIDPATGRAGAEPLATLATYRRDWRLEGITFGMNAIVERPGPIAVGDTARATWNF